MRHVRLTRLSFLAALVIAAPVALYACSSDSSSSSTTSSGGGNSSESSSTTTSSNSSTTSSSSGTGGTGGTGGAGSGSSSSASSSVSSTGSSMLTGKIKVTVSYTGKQTGPLIVAAVKDFPPKGPPDAFTKIAAPAYPQIVELPIAAGSYYVTAILDVGNNYMTMPGPEDLVGLSMAKVDVKGNDEPTVDVPLKDKM